MKFIFSQASLVDAETMQGVIYNKDNDISKALHQIHEKSLRQIPLRKKWNAPSSVSFYKSKSYKEIHQNPTTTLSETERITTSQLHQKSQQEWFNSKKIFFTNLPEEVQVKEVWKKCKQYADIKHILFPRKKDRFGKRFGFIITKNNLEARR